MYAYLECLIEKIETHSILRFFNIYIYVYIYIMSSFKRIENKHDVYRSKDEKGFWILKKARNGDN